MVRGSKAGGAEIFPTHPDRRRVQTASYTMDTRDLSRGQNTRLVTNATHPLRPQDREWVELCLCLSSALTLTCNGITFNINLHSLCNLKSTTHLAWNEWERNLS